MKRIYAALLALGFAFPLYAQNCASEINPGTTRDCKFATITTTGAPTTLSGSPVVKAYKGNSTSTEVTTGITLTADFDSVTGLNNLHVDFSDTFYATGSDITFVITTGTVGGTSAIGYIPWQTHIYDGIVTTANGAANFATLFENGTAATTAILSTNGFSIKKNTAKAAFPIKMRLASNTNTGVTGATVTCNRSIDGAAFATTGLTNITEVTSGWYTVDWSAGALNGNNIVLRCTSTGGSGTSVAYEQVIVTQQ